jgi:hypothetical protein
MCAQPEPERRTGTGCSTSADILYSCQAINLEKLLNGGYTPPQQLPNPCPGAPIGANTHCIDDDTAGGSYVDAASNSTDRVLPKPKVSDATLQNYVDNLYRGTTGTGRVGDGTTADAVRNELATGEPTGGRFHTTKAQETINGLRKWLNTNPNASYSDRVVAQSLLDDLLDSLRGGV